MATLDKQILEQMLADDLDAKEICDAVLFDDNVWLLEQLHGDDAAEVYARVRTFVRETLDNPELVVHIVGSAKTGYSLSPLKWSSSFSRDSDLDLAIAAPDLFERSYRELSHQYLKKRIRYNDTIGRSLLGSHIPLMRNSLGDSALLKRLMKQSGILKRKFGQNFSIHNTVNFRIYRSEMEARLYHIHSIEALKRKVAQ